MTNQELIELRKQCIKNTQSVFDAVGMVSVDHITLEPTNETYMSDVFANLFRYFNGPINYNRLIFSFTYSIINFY